jgi:integrase
MWRGEVMVGYRPDGKPDRRYVYAKTYKACQEKLEALKARARSGVLPDADKERVTIAAYLSRWVETTKTSVRDRTHKRYGKIVNNHLIPGLGRHKLSALKPDHVQAFYADRLTAPVVRTSKKGKPIGSGKPLSPRTVFHCHRVLHRALEMAVRWGYVQRNLCDAVDAPKVPQKEIKPPTPQQVVGLLDAAEAAGDRYVALWTLAAMTGACQGELLGLQWGDVRLEDGTLTIQRSLKSAKGGVPDFDVFGPSKSRRTVDLAPDVVVALTAHRDRQAWERQKLGDGWAPYDLVFTTRLGTPLGQNTVTNAFKRALKRVGLDRATRFHDLRHGAITMMLRAGQPVTTVSEMVGHHSPAMTYGVYGHVIPGTGSEAAERLQDALRAARQAAV